MPQPLVWYDLGRLIGELREVLNSYSMGIRGVQCDAQATC